MKTGNALNKLSSWVKRNLSSILLFLVAVLMFFYNLGYPSDFIFDEAYHIPSAQKYLFGAFFQENHPPLGKMLIAAGDWMWEGRKSSYAYIDTDHVNVSAKDVNFVGYRLASAWFGVLTTLVIFWLLSELVKNRLVAFCVALLALFDNSFLLQSRAALLDSFVMFFIWGSVLVSVKLIKKTDTENPYLLGFSTLGVFVGAAFATKQNGFVAILPAILAILIYGIKKNWLVALNSLAVFITCFSLVYVGVWKLHYQIGHTVLQGRDYGMTEDKQEEVLVQRRGRLEQTFAQLTEGWLYNLNYNRAVPSLDLCSTDEIGSPWYYWPFGGKPINYRWELVDNNTSRYSFLVGNPITWMVSLIGVILGTAFTLMYALGLLKAKENKWKIVGFVVFYWSYMLAIAQIKRVMYLYHYLPPLFVGLVIFALIVDCLDYSLQLSKRFSLRVINVMIILLVAWAIIAFMRYKPFTYFEPITNDRFKKLEMMKLWQVKPMGEENL